MIFKLDINDKSYTQCKDISQFDSRVIAIELFQNGQPYSIATKTIKLEAKNSNNNAIIQTDGITKSNNVITVNLKEDITRVSGKVEMKIVLTENSKSISTFKFMLNVDSSVTSSANILPAITIDVIEILQNKIDEAVKVKDDTVQAIEDNKVAMEKMIEDNKVSNDKVIADNVITINKITEDNKQLIAQNKVAVKQDIAEINSHLEDKASNVALDVERQRINTFTSLAQGSTTGDAELIDGRVGANGILYSSIGSANREQFTKINDDIFDSVKDTSDISTWNIGYATQNGTTYKVSVTGFETYKYGIADVYSGEVLKLTFYEVNGYNIIFLNGDTFVSKTHLISSGYNQKTDMVITVPSGVNKIIVNTVGDKQYKIVSDSYKFSSKIEKIQTNLTEINSDISQIKDSIAIANNVINCWGDSLTDGSGSTLGNDYPSVLQRLVGDNYKVNNYGLAGEGSQKICQRRGAIPIYIEPITIPASGSVTGVVIKDWLGTQINNLFTRGGRLDETEYTLSKFAINPVIINGVRGNLKQTSLSNNTYTFIRETEGQPVVIDRPTLISTFGNNLKNNKIDVFYLGTNDSINPNSVEKIKNHINYMIDKSNTKGQYIIIGLTSKTYDNTIVTDNLYLQNEFGNHFLDVRKYMLNYGLSDSNLTPTSEDINSIANGFIPPSLYKADLVHFNDYGYKILAEQVYKKCIELGYI